MVGVSKVKKKFAGVSRIGNSWQARVRDPKMRSDLYLGCYTTPEEASLAVRKKMLEIQEAYKGVDGFGLKISGVSRVNIGRSRVRAHLPKLENDCSEEAATVAEKRRAEFRAIVADKKRRAEFQVLEKSEIGDVRELSGCLQEQTGYVKVPPGVTRLKSGKWVARIRDPIATTRIWLGTYDTADEAIRSLNMRKDLLAAKMSQHEVVSVPGKLENEFVDASNSVFEDENTSSLPVSDEICGLDFDRPGSSGFINEYGQLLGNFSELDEQMSLSLPQ